MSWLCSNCGTENQDAEPLCTVCDCVAPVIQSYLSLDKINRAKLYADALSQIDQCEHEGNYTRMANEAVSAITTYEDNALAVDKLRLAIHRECQTETQRVLLSLIGSALTDDKYELAECAITIWDELHLSPTDIVDYKASVKMHKTTQESVDLIIADAKNRMTHAQPQESLTILDKALAEHPAEKRLLEYRQIVQEFIAALNAKDVVAPSSNRKGYPRILRPESSDNPITASNDSHSTECDSIQVNKRKFPKVKRNTNN